ncbi:MAG: C-GCAxxG-C-C family protein [Oscillospiraceae bacterium]|nr:C-GCAxxG-C-C family protein [Oscillospiraceae bacterium]
MTKMEEVLALRAMEEPHYNCAQSMLVPFAEELGLTREQAYDLALDFGGGMGCGGLCGVLTGSMMVMGGKGVPQEARERLVEQFRARHGAVNCDELTQGLESHTPEKKERCDALICEGMKWLLKELEQE